MNEYIYSLTVSFLGKDVYMMKKDASYIKVRSLRLAPTCYKLQVQETSAASKSVSAYVGTCMCLIIGACSDFCFHATSDATVRPPTVKTIKLGDTVGLTASVTIRRSEFILIPSNRECVLCFAVSHTAENIATLLKECSEVRYPIGTRLDSITTDNGANFKAAVQQLVPNHATREFIQLFRDITNAIRNSSRRLEHLQKEKTKAYKDIIEIINDSNEGKCNVL